MNYFSSVSEKELNEIYNSFQIEYDNFKTQNLKLDMSRGKPCSEQLDLSMELFNCLSVDDYKAIDGTDVRNYAPMVDGLPEAKELFSKMLGVSTKEIIVGGNASLNLMYDAISRAMILGVVGSEKPWGKLPVVKFLCPSPGYDRHFAICQLLNIEMITIDMKPDGPDMDKIEKLVSEDDSIKGIWCVPKYSNPDGITYSDEVVTRFANMKTKAKDFRIFWDDAYTIHFLSDEYDQLKNILTACKEAGNPDRVFIFSSTSKISFPGAGVAMMAGSENNINAIKKQMGVQTIGPDKINQLRHVRYFKNLENIEAHMKKQAEILKPKFDMVLELFDKELGGKDIAWWNKPNGGYFISLNTLEGCAKAVVSMALEAGVKLTNAGDTFPYGKDPLDRNIRIAPTFPTINDLEKAIKLVCICIKLVSVRKSLACIKNT
jgi:aspartate/methionine/tyrosine aminotransferase